MSFFGTSAGSALSNGIAQAYREFLEFYEPLAARSSVAAWVNYGRRIAARLTAALKQAVALARPAALEGVRVFTAADSEFSFPSGHAVFAGLLATGLWPLLPRWGRLAAALFALGVAVSRVWLGAHFPSDVGAGLLLGIAVGVWTRWVSNRISGIRGRAWQSRCGEN